MFLVCIKVQWELRGTQTEHTSYEMLFLPHLQTCNKLDEIQSFKQFLGVFLPL